MTRLLGDFDMMDQTPSYSSRRMALRAAGIEAKMHALFVACTAGPDGVVDPTRCSDRDRQRLLEYYTSSKQSVVKTKSMRSSKSHSKSKKLRSKSHSKSKSRSKSDKGNGNDRTMKVASKVSFPLTRKWMKQQSQTR